MLRKVQEESGSGSETEMTGPSVLHVGFQHPKVKRILVPLDFSESSCKALDHALGLADQLGATLVLLNVVEPAVTSDQYVALTPTFDLANEQLVEAGRERLNEVCRKRVGHRRCETLVRIGRAPSEIVDTAQAVGADLIILGASGRGESKDPQLGSTVERVLRHAACPVLTVTRGR